jgi:hypothetical protein
MSKRAAPHLIATVDKSRSSQLRVSVSRWRQQTTVEIREATATVPGCYFPTPNGVVLDIEQPVRTYRRLAEGRGRSGQLGTDHREDTVMTDLLSWLPLPSGKSLRWLLSQGVLFDTLYALRSAWVKFDGNTFDFDPECSEDPILIFGCEDRGEVIDLAVWSARENRLATWRSTAFCVGDVDQCFNPATWFNGDGLCIHRSPLDWLRADRKGIVILKPKLCWAHLRHVPRVICADVQHGDLVKRWIKPPQSQTEIFIETNIVEGIAA